MTDTDFGTASHVAAHEDGRLQSLAQQLEELGMAIGSGDLESVQSIFDTIVSRLPGGTEIGGDDPVGAFLLAVEDGIAAGDLESLEAAADEFAIAEAPDDESWGAMAHAAMADSAVKDCLTHLLEALQMDDTEEAETAFESLMLAFNDSEFEADGDNPLGEMLDLISDALLTGDTEQARALLFSAIQTMGSRSMLNSAY